MEKLNAEQKAFGQVIQKAWDDPQFKAALIDSPIETIKRETGFEISLPAGVHSLEVQDQSDASKAYLVIPSRPNVDEMELTDEQLEMVAGGEFVSWAVSTLIVTLIVSGGVGVTVNKGGGEDKKEAPKEN